jgi:hypothetical protein
MASERPSPADVKEPLEGNHGEVRRNPEAHLPEGPIALLGGEDMMSHRLDIPEAAFQRAAGSTRRRSRDAACEVDRPDGAAHRVGHREQQVRLLLERVGLAVEASPPRFAQGVEKQRAP